jgi:anti-sigma regulatory factor (Ser/Thr protein kinase)
MSTTNVLNLTADPGEWLKGLSFYKDEVKHMTHQLEEITSKYTRQAVMQQVEHFQNQFLLRQTQIDELRHAINENLNLAAYQAKNGAGHVDEGVITLNKELGEDYISLEKAINDLRHEFNVFSSALM